jgi:hypothetical protein
LKTTTVTHALIGGLFAMLFYLQSTSTSYKSERQFGKAHVIVFALNSFIGPDIGKIGLAIGPLSANPIIWFINDAIHNVFGWLLFSIPLTILYFWIFNGFRQSPIRNFNPPHKKTQDMQLNNRKIQIHTFSILKLLIAAGITHFSIDALDSEVRVFPSNSIFPYVTFSVEGFKSGAWYTEGPFTSIFPWFGMSELFLIGIVFLILIIYAFYKKPLKWVYILSIIFVILIVGILILFGSDIVREENDLGFLFYCSIFWVIPIGFMIWSYEPTPISTQRN